VRALLVLATSRMEPGCSRIGAIGSLVMSCIPSSQILSIFYVTFDFMRCLSFRFDFTFMVILAWVLS
jgi:hypothetical protein